MKPVECLDSEQATRESIDNEAIGNENTSNNSGICEKNEVGGHDSKPEDNHDDEKLECTTETEDNNTDEKSESPIAVEGNDLDEELEYTVKTEDDNSDVKASCAIKTEDNKSDDKLSSAIKSENNNADQELESTIKNEPTKEDIAAILSLREEIGRKRNLRENSLGSQVSTFMMDDAAEDKSESINEQNISKDNIKYSRTELAKNEERRNSPEIVVEPKVAERLPSGKITPQIIQVVTPVNGTVPVGLSLPPKTQRISKKHSCCRKFKHCLYLIIFTMIVIGYAIGGAYLFSHLERQRDIEHNAKIDKWKNDTAILLATELRQVKPHEDIWARKVFHYLEVYEKDLLKASALGYRRQDHKDRDQKWTWASSLFFSVSLMTSSGYGPMTPRSKMGRVTAMFYSLFGIPLTFIWFMVTGCILAKVWLSFFQNICCHLCREKINNSQLEELSKVSQNKLPKIAKLRSNSIVPVEEQKLLSQNKLQRKNSGRCRQKMFPEELLDDLNRNDHLANKDFQHKMRQIEFLETEEFYSIDYAVAIIYAFLLFVIYCIFSSVLISIYEKWILTDILYVSFLMFLTLGPGCHELDDDEIEIKMKNNVFFTVHLCIGYCILSMIVSLFYKMVRGKRKSEKLQNHLVFDSCFREKF